MSEFAGFATALRQLHDRTDVDARLRVDPVSWPRRYALPADREVAAWIAACLAFGRASGFGAVLARLFALADLAGGPARWAVDFGPEDRAAVARLSWRWTRGGDLADLVAATGAVVRDRGSLEAAAGEGSAHAALTGLVDALRHADGRAAWSRGLHALWPSPRDGSACKRGNLFLRWMVRADDGVDLGVWSRLRPSALVVPVDTHMGRIARLLGLTSRATNDWRTAMEITAALRAVDPDDPVRFDFALTHLGMSGACRARFVAPVCGPCAVRAWCAAGSQDQLPGPRKR